MRSVGYAACLALLVLAGCDEPATRRGPSSLPVKNVVAGFGELPLGSISQARLPAADLLMEFRASAPAGLRFDMLAPMQNEPSAIVALLALRDFQPVVKGVTEDDLRGLSAIDALTEGDLTLVIGSGFVAEFSPLAPLGLLQVDGVTTSGLQRHGYTRVLGVRPGEMGVVGRQEFHTGLFESALQVGPGIVENGKLDISERELQLPAFIRTFVATCEDQVMVGATEEPSHLNTLGKRVLAFAARNELTCDEVVNLSGDREVLLALRSPGGERIVYFGNPKTLKASLVGFRASDTLN